MMIIGKAVKIPRFVAFVPLVTMLACCWFLDYQNSFETVYKRATAGDTQAQFELSRRYWVGQSVPINKHQGYQWLLKAAEAGNVDAQLFLANFDSDGKVLPERKAEKWLYRAAQEGSLEAQARLGSLYLSTGAANYKKALYWLRKAASKHYAPAQTSLGYAYYYGYGVPQDYAQSFAWTRAAALQGDSFAMGNLAECYIRGLGVARDYGQALSWYKESVRNGSLLSAVNVGYIYAHGLGVPQDFQEAERWYSRVLIKGHPELLFHISESFYTGESTEKDNVESYFWARVAASQGEARAKSLLKTLDAKLSDSQKQQVQDRIHGLQLSAIH